MGVEISSIGALVVLLLDLWAIVSVIGSAGSTGGKVIWILLILVLPIAGFLLWLIAGPKATRSTA